VRRGRKVHKKKAMRNPRTGNTEIEVFFDARATPGGRIVADAG
jgi:hypothetical protein